MIKGFIGRDYNSSEEDVVATKKVLKKLGYYKLPSYGLTPYADEGLFSAISAFQKDKGLKANGQIKKDDKTANLLGLVADEDTGLDDVVNEPEDDPNAKSPMFRCIECGTPHGGSHGDLCRECFIKLS